MTESLLDRVIARDPVAVARAISKVEDNAAAPDLMKGIFRALVAR